MCAVEGDERRRAAGAAGRKALIIVGSKRPLAQWLLYQRRTATKRVHDCLTYFGGAAVALCSQVCSPTINDKQTPPLRRTLPTGSARKSMPSRCEQDASGNQQSAHADGDKTGKKGE
jgi:hypothetical protein